MTEERKRKQLFEVFVVHSDKTPQVVYRKADDAVTHWQQRGGTLSKLWVTRDILNFWGVTL